MYKMSEINVAIVMCSVAIPRN